MSKTQDNGHTGRSPQRPDLLAAVVLHILVTKGQDGISLEHMTRLCERDPGDLHDHQEVHTAFKILMDDQLAEEDGDGTRFRPTRAAVRAAELSF